MEKQEFVNEVKEQIDNDVTAPVKRTYNRHIAQVHLQGGGDRALPEFHMIRAQLHRARVYHAMWGIFR